MIPNSTSVSLISDDTPDTAADDTAKKTPLTGADMPEADTPDVTFSAGHLRGQMTKDGVKVGVFDRTDAEDEAAYRAELNAVSMVEESMDTSPLLPALPMPKWIAPVQIGALVVSGAWVLFAFLSLAFGPQAISVLTLPQLGGALAGILAPVALLWLGLGQLTRAYDAQRYGEAMRAELHALIFPSEDRQQRISHDIEKLCQQAAELSTASRMALKAIQKSRQALQMEAKEFALLSRKAEVHIDRLAENLTDRAGKLQGVTEEIERRVTGIDTQTSAGTDAWHKAADHMLAKVAEIETALGHGADRILEAAGSAQTKTVAIETQLNATFDHLSGSIDTVTEKLSGLSSEFDSHSENLGRATDRVVDETGRLGQIIQSQIADLQGMSAGVFEQVAKSSEIIKVQRDTLDESARSLNVQAETIAAKIRDSAAHLDEVSASVGARTGDAQDRVLRAADGLRSVMNDLDNQVRNVETSGSAVSNRLTEALSVALTGSETLSSATRRAVDALEKASLDARARADEIARQTESSVHNLQDASIDQQARAESLITKLKDSRELLLSGAEQADAQAKKVVKLYEDQAAAMSVAVGALSERLLQAGSALDTPLRAVNTAVAEADRRHEMIDQTLTRRVEDLSKASDKARDTADQISQLLRTQAQDMSVLSGQIAGQVRGIGDQIAQQRDVISTQTERAVSDMTRVQNSLERQVSTLRDVSTIADTDLTRLHDRVIDKTTHLKSEAEGMITRLTQVDDRITHSVEKLADESDRLRESVEGAATSLDRAAEHAEPIYRRVLDQANHTQERIEAMNRTFESTATSNLERLQQVGIVFDDRLSQLRVGVQEAAQTLRASGDELRNRVDDIETASTHASERMETVNKQLGNQISDIHLLTDQALLKVEAVQRSVESQFHELNAAVGKAVTELETAQDRFGAATRAVDDMATSAMAKLETAARDTVGESQMLQTAAASVVKTTQDLMATLQSDAKTLLQSAGESLLELKKMGDSISLRAHEVEEHIKSALTTSQSYAHDLKTQVTMIAAASAENADKVAESVSLLNHKIGDVERSAQVVAEQVDQVRGKLGNETDRFLANAKQAVVAAEEASSAYARQSNVLFKAAQDATAQVEKIRDVHLRTQRDTFLSSAKFVVESLHSLAVDFVRVLEGEVQEKTWKAFQKGDIAAFTRRLVDGATQIPADKIRAKFTGDTEFRSYVQRYIRTFEDLFDQAQGNDHGELLAATFLSSDVGKLYQMLCTTTGREAKMGRDLVRAA